MWGFIFIFLAFALFLYIYFLRRELRKLKHEIKDLPSRSGFGSRLSLDFREKALMELIDELNQMVDVFEEKNRESKRMEESVKLSIAGLSHDLRTPLTSINGYVQLLQVVTDESKKGQYLKIINHSINRLLEMTDHFYDLAQIETNQKEIALSSITLSHLVEEIFLSFYDQLEEREIDIHFPEHLNSQQIIADKLLLTRVIQNVVQNVLRYGKGQAVISYSKEDSNLIFRIKNDIKPDSKVIIEKVFMLFYTEVTSRTNTEASGLGLYISKMLVEKMNGKMKADLKDNWFILQVHLPISKIQT